MLLAKTEIADLFWSFHEIPVEKFVLLILLLSDFENLIYNLILYKDTFKMSSVVQDCYGKLKVYDLYYAICV